MDLNNALANLAVSFRARAEQADRDALSIETENNRLVAIGMPRTGLPDPAEKRALARWFRNHEAACKEGLVLYMEGPRGAEPLLRIPGMQEAMRAAQEQGRVRFAYQTPQPSGSEGAKNEPAHL
jgi:hypothetical protein